MLINFFLYLYLKKFPIKREKNDISYILAVILTINSVEYLSVLTSFR